MSCRLASLLASVTCVAVALAVAPEPEKPPAPSGTWSVKSEVYVSAGGLVISNDTSASWYYYDWEFAEEKVSYDVLYSCGTREDNEYAFKLDAQHSPAWLDLIKGEKVELGILRRQGKELVWLRGPIVSLQEWKKANGNLPARPRKFELDEKQKGASLLVLKRGS
jgi:hypothetical protein